MKQLSSKPGFLWDNVTIQSTVGHLQANVREFLVRVLDHHHATVVEAVPFAAIGRKRLALAA